MENLASRLKSERKARGWSQDVLAKRAGVSPTTIAELETNPGRTTTRLLNIARALSVSPTWLETGKGPKFVTMESSQLFLSAESISDLADKLARFSPDDFGELMRLVMVAKDPSK